MLNWLRRLLRKWLVRPRLGSITSREVGVKSILTDKIISNSIRIKVAKIMGDSLAGHPYDECEKRGCYKLDVADD